MTPEEAFEKWWHSNPGACDANRTCRGAFKSGIDYQENQQLLCLVQIREALGDKDAKLSHQELMERVKGLTARVSLLTEILEAFRLKRSVDGLNGRTWCALKHADAEDLIDSLEETLDERRETPDQICKWQLFGDEWRLLVHGRGHAASVWTSGTWHTWNPSGIGGENSSEETVAKAKVEAAASAIAQGFI